MIDFDHNQLLSLAKDKAKDGWYEEALSIIQSAPKTPDCRQFEFKVRYLLAKEEVALGTIQKAYENFRECTQNSVNIEVRALAQIRCKLIKDIFDNPATGVSTFRGLYSSSKTKDVVSLSPDSLQPEIWYVGSAAAYRSFYDPESGDSLSKLIRRIKHSAEEQTLSKLGKLLADFVFSDTPVLRSADFVVPVPTSPDRWNIRGYRIPHRLAEEISKSCAIPINSNVLETVGNIAELRRLPRYLRSKEIAGSYQVTKQSDLDGKSILLVDDIITTGSTVTEIARTLINAGAAEVAAVSLAHTERSY